jgi:hypothetical protein
MFGGTAKDCRYLWVWEWQKRGALHWHCVLEVPDRKSRDVVMEGFKPLWIRVIHGIGKRAAIDMAADGRGGTHEGNYGVWQDRAEIARKRPDRYLAKYVSKGKGEGKGFFPTRWYGINRRLHQQLKDETIHLETHASNAERHILQESDLNLIDTLMSAAYLARHFPDKVGQGYNFVVYLEDEPMNEAKRIFGDIKRTMELKGASEVRNTMSKNFVGLENVTSRSWLLERYLGDLGSYYKKLYYRWLDEDPSLPEAELFWLEHYARRLLYVVGLDYQGQPPERCGAGLPCQNEPTILASPPPP